MELLEKLKIKTDNIVLYEQALTHTSYANEMHVSHYERLEFLGDVVLGLAISEYLYKTYEYEEGVLTKLRAQYVCEAALYTYGMELGINSFIRLGKGELDSGGRKRKVIVADVVEAFLGAMFLDKGFDYSNKFIKNYIIPLIESGKVLEVTDYKSELQELVQTDRRSLEYFVVKEDGPAHMKEYTISVKIDNIIYGTGVAGSKKEAEQLAAKDALKKSVKN